MRVLDCALSQLRLLWKRPLALFLPLQALLVSLNLGRLPVWTDELFTVQTAPQSLTRIIEIVRADIHPPLYFLLAHAWIQLPFPGDVLERIRLMSGVWTLAATFLLDRLWLARLRPERRFAALALWCLSPAVVLYGRMGRSYLMQAALAVLAVALAWRFLRRPGVAKMLLSAGSALLLLYTHYLPGIAVSAAFAAGLLATAARQRDPRRLRLLAAWGGLIVLGYLPWLLLMAGALRRWAAASGFSSRYMLTGALLTEHAVKAGYALVSFTIGETFPVWALAVVPATAVLLALSFRRAWTVSRGFVGLLIFAAALGYTGVARWVSYPFMPARLIWLLPFFLLWIALAPGAPRRVRAAVIGLLVVSDAVSLGFYYTGANFLNKTYRAPLREIAAQVRASSGSVLLVDRYNTDAGALLYYLPGRQSLELSRENEPLVRKQVADPAVRDIWIVRNTHDVSPGGVAARLEDAACRGKTRRLYQYLPYEPWERAAMRLAGIRNGPAFFYQATHCVAP